MGHCQIGLLLCYTTYRQASAGQATLLPCGASLLYIQYYVHRVVTFPSNGDTSPLRCLDCVLNSCGWLSKRGFFFLIKMYSNDTCHKSVQVNICVVPFLLKIARDNELAHYHPHRTCG